MRVLFVAPENTATGGSFLSMIELCKQLRERHGIEPVVITSMRGDGTGLLKDNHIEFITLPMYLPTYSHKLHVKDIIKSAIKILLMPLELYSSWKIKKYLQNGDIDIVHINNVFPLGAASAALDAHIPLVWHVREMFDADYQFAFIRGNDYAWSLLRRADRVVAISDVVYRKYKHVLSVDNNMVTVYNGISNEFYSEHKILESPIVAFVCIGQFIEHKNHRELIEACRILKNKGIYGYKLILVGKGSLKQSLKGLVKKYGLTEQVTFEGTRNDIPRFLEKCDVVCVPSSSEAFGRTFVEGMLSGCLVIGVASSLSAAEEIVSDGYSGLLYRSGHPDELARKMEEIIGRKYDERMRSIARQGQSTAMEKFTSEKNADMIMEVYEDVLKNKVNF